MRPTLHKTDANQRKIMNALRNIGATVCDLAPVGDGCPDILVGFRGVNYLIEIKNMDGRGMRFTEAEQEFKDTWRGQWTVVTNVDQAIAVVEAV